MIVGHTEPHHFDIIIVRKSVYDNCVCDLTTTDTKATWKIESELLVVKQMVGKYWFRDRDVSRVCGSFGILNTL